VEAAGIAALRCAPGRRRSRELALKGKPDPDMFLKSAESLAVAPGRSIVFETQVAGVQAGRRGGRAGPSG
jgi:HAD superfamily hydrolase (TIGR01509 family)